MADTGIVRDIPKNSNEIFRVEITEFKGSQYLNIRVWYRDKDGEFKPTQKGIAVAPEIFPQLKDAILEAESRLQG